MGWVEAFRAFLGWEQIGLKAVGPRSHGFLMLMTLTMQLHIHGTKSAYGFNVNLVFLNPLILKCARGPGRNNQALGIKYAKSGLVFFGGV